MLNLDIFFDHGVSDLEHRNIPKIHISVHLLRFKPNVMRHSKRWSLPLNPTHLPNPLSSLNQCCLLDESTAQRDVEFSSLPEETMYHLIPITDTGRSSCCL
jgi:hypothetical protein